MLTSREESKAIGRLVSRSQVIVPYFFRFLQAQSSIPTRPQDVQRCLFCGQLIYPKGDKPSWNYLPSSRSSASTKRFTRKWSPSSTPSSILRTVPDKSGHRHPTARTSHPRCGRVIRQHETARLNVKEWGRLTDLGPSEKSKDERRAFFFCGAATRVALAWTQKSDSSKGKQESVNSCRDNAPLFNIILSFSVTSLIYRSCVLILRQ